MGCVCVCVSYRQAGVCVCVGGVVRETAGLMGGGKGLHLPPTPPPPPPHPSTPTFRSLGYKAG